jgi:hypothetical protein
VDEVKIRTKDVDKVVRQFLRDEPIFIPAKRASPTTFATTSETPTTLKSSESPAKKGFNLFEMDSSIFSNTMSPAELDDMIVEAEKPAEELNYIARMFLDETTVSPKVAQEELAGLKNRLMNGLKHVMNNSDYGISPTAEPTGLVDAAKKSTRQAKRERKISSN